MKARYPTEEYTPERIAEFLLNNAVDADDYAAALDLEEVRKLGIDPAKQDGSLVGTLCVDY